MPSSQGPVVEFVNRHQIAITRNLLASLYIGELAGARYFPLVHKYASRFLHLQYISDNRGGNRFYDIGINDAYHVVYWVVFLTFLRAVLMQYVFDPIAKHQFLVLSRKARVRFAEQSWLVVYYCFSFALGSYLYYNSSYWNNIDNIFIGWPHYKMSALFKKYYLISIAFWLHQLVTLNIEERRKDYVQMFIHHIVTCSLVIGSYYYYYNRIGNLILNIMDSVDILLSTAKILKYSSYARACDAMFGLFVIAWVALRHGVYNYLFYISWHRSKELMQGSECVAGLIQKRCWNSFIINGFLSLLGGLQIISLVWLYMIGKVILRVIRGQNAEDVRSDTEDTDDELTAKKSEPSK